MNSKGVTLIELLIYVVLVVGVIALLSSPLQEVLKKDASEQQQSSLQNSSRDIASTMSREIRNTGFKRYILSSGGAYVSTVIQNTFLSDSSSFILKQGNPSDTLTFYKASIDNNGNSTGNVDSIKYYLSSNELKRKAGTKEMSLGADIYALQFKVGQLNTDSLLFKADTFKSSQWERTGVASLTLSGTDLAVAYSGSGKGVVTLSTSNTFPINSSSRIKIKYDITNETSVSSNIDSLRWDILNGSGKIIATDYFKPGIESGYMILPISSAVSTARVQLSAACKSTTSLVIKKIEIRKIDLGAIQWSDTVAVNKKKYVKVIKIMVLQRSSKKADSYTGGTINVANITYNRSGDYAWRLLSETVEILNNGLF